MIQRINASVAIISFENGLQAIEWLLHSPEALAQQGIILLDLNMPVMNGWGFLEQWHSLSASYWDRWSIYVISSSLLSQDIENALRFPSVKDFITKPLSSIHLKELLAVEG